MKNTRRNNKGRVLNKGERQRADGTYEYRFTYKGDRSSIYASTLSELREKEDEISKQKLNGGKINAKKTTINDEYVRWKNVKEGIKNNTMCNYIQYYKTHVLGDFGKNKISEITRTDIKGFYKRKHQEGLTPNSIGIIHNVLHQVFETAIDDKIIDYNPTDGAMDDVNNIREKKEVIALTIEQEKAFLNHVKNTPCFSKLFPVFIVLLRTGMRVGELCGLQIEDIDFDKSLIHVSHDLVYFRHPEDPIKKYRFEMHPTKTKSSIRTISFLGLDDVRDAIIQEIEMNKMLGIKCKEPVDGYSNFVFYNQLGGLLSYHDLNKSMDRIVKSYNKKAEKEFGDMALLLPHLTTHCCRKSYSTRANEFSLNEKYRLSTMGHTKSDMTNNVYTKVTDDLITKNMKIYKEQLEENGLIFSTPLK